MDLGNKIIENIDNPHELEKMYRKDPETFKKSFSYAWKQNPSSQVLAVWYERLHYNETSSPEKNLCFRKTFYQ